MQNVLWMNEKYFIFWKWTLSQIFCFKMHYNDTFSLLCICFIVNKQFWFSIWRTIQGNSAHISLTFLMKSRENKVNNFILSTLLLCVYSAEIFTSIYKNSHSPLQNVFGIWKRCPLTWYRILYVTVIMCSHADELAGAFCGCNNSCFPAASSFLHCSATLDLTLSLIEHSKLEWFWNVLQSLLHLKRVSASCAPNNDFFLN